MAPIVRFRSEGLSSTAEVSSNVGFMLFVDFATEISHHPLKEVLHCTIATQLTFYR